MQSCLSLIDWDFRDSLYNHNEYHTLHNDKSLFIPKSKFTYQNIHMRLGGVRYHTTINRRLWKPTISNIICRSYASKEVRYKTKTRQNLFEDNYSYLVNLLLNNKNLNKIDLQILIEKFLHSQEALFSNDIELKNILKNSDEAFNLIKKKRVDITKLLKNKLETSVKTNKSNIGYITWCKEFIGQLGYKKITDLLIGFFLYIISKEIAVKDDVLQPGIPTIEAFNKFGKILTRKYLYSKYVKSEFKENMTLNQYIQTNKEEFSEIYTDNFYAKVGGFFVWDLVTLNLLYQELDTNPGETKETIYYLRIVSEVRKILIKDNYKVYYLPMKLPMICPPKEFVYSSNIKENKLGGYLLNDVFYTNHIIKNKIGIRTASTLQDDNIIVSLINGMSRVPYKINVDTLEFIYKYGIEKNIVLDYTTEEMIRFKNPYNIPDKSDRKRLRSSLSKIILEKNILNIAETYSNEDKLYFPLLLDQRGRIYCETDYFDYQKNDLAKGLISFVEPGRLYKHDIYPIKYFKAYGANLYGEGLDKKSLNYRVKWVDDNTDFILDFESNDIIKNAENKATFVSFCFEYRRFVEFMNDKNAVVFNTYLPIQLDASCNGYQHLTLLTKENVLFDKLNLSRSTFDDNPDDFYSYIVEKTDMHIKSKIEALNLMKNKTNNDIKQLNSLILLSKLGFNRSIVKKTIMTKSYNATVPKLVQNIADSDNIETFIQDKLEYYIYKNKKDLVFTKQDIVTYVMAIISVLNRESPRIKELSKYIDNIATICCTLGFNIEWVLPSGLK